MAKKQNQKSLRPVKINGRYSEKAQEALESETAPSIADNVIDLALDMLVVLGHANDTDQVLDELHAAIAVKYKLRGFDLARANFGPEYCKADDIDFEAGLESCFELAAEYLHEVTKDDLDSEWICKKCKLAGEKELAEFERKMSKKKRTKRGV